MRIDIMVDIETLGKDVKSPIFQIGACAFNIKSSEILDKFSIIADLSMEKNLNVDGDTLYWWLNTNANLLRDLICSSSKISQRNMFEKFNKWILNLQEQYGMQNVFLWGNGMLFDNKLIQAKMVQYGLNYPIFYRNDRDMRTIVELAAINDGCNTEKEFRDKYKDNALVEHNGFDDTLAQIKILSKAWNLLIK